MTDLNYSKSDVTLNIIKAGVSAIPYGGGLLASLISDFIPTELNKRRDNLLLQLEKSIKLIEEKIDNEVLTKPYFISIFLQSVKSALATEKEEKIDCYKSIILNTLISNDPDTDELSMILKITDSLTPLHIKLLKIFKDPREYLEINPEIKAHMENVSMGGTSTLISKCFSSYSNDLISVAMKDLETMNLAHGLTSGVTMTLNGILSPRLTEFGLRYLSFITS